MATAFICGLAAILGVAGIRRLQRVKLDLHPTVPTGSLYMLAVIASLVVGTLPLVQLLMGARTPVAGEGMWSVESCLLLFGFVFLIRRSQRLESAGLTFTAGLCILAGAELIVRTARQSDTFLALGIPCMFWTCGLLQLALWCDRFLPIVLRESIAARKRLRSLMPVIFAVPVVVVILTSTLERLGFCDRGVGNAVAASVFCGVMALVVVFFAGLLGQTEQSFWQLFEESHEAIFMVDPITQHIRCTNGKAAKVLGDLADQPTGCSIEEMFRMIQLDRLRELESPQNANWSRESIEFCRREASGLERWFELRGTLAPFRGSETLMVHARDISARRYMERAQSRIEKMQALSQLAGGMAHDFRNLLGGISLCTAALASEFAENAESRELLKHVDSSIERAQQLTQWLLAYCRQSEVSFQRVDLNGLLMSVAGRLRGAFDPKISVQTNLCNEREQVLVDPAQMQEVLINLAVNARDAMPAGGTLSFETHAVKLSAADGNQQIQPGRYLVLSVVDTGVGMSEETAAHAFEPFYTTKQRNYGTGLGLSVVDGIVRQHGGVVRLESSAGKGTRVDIYLPICDQISGPTPATDTAA
jgi:PAS domain S-box-containing protein